MKLTILGSGVKIPFPGRGNSGYFLQTSEHNILIDGGSGTIRRVADFGLDYRSIDTIFYTHMHPDHTFDLIPLLFAWKHDPLVVEPVSLQIICPQGFVSYFNKLMEIYGDWVLDDNISIDLKEVDREEIILRDLTVTCGRTEHTDHSVTYRFVEDGDRSLFYSGDTDVCNELIISGEGAHTVLLECSLPDDKKMEGHLTPTECGEIATKMGCKRLILTHFLPSVLEIDISSLVKTKYDGEIILAIDGMKLEI
jgi:ribonuclease BN (tRNA processing enzyme)